MKSLKVSWLILLVVQLLGCHAFSQTASDPADQTGSNSYLSPQRLEQFQNEEAPAQQKDVRTIRTMYRNVNFIDFRGVDFTSVLDSGFSKDTDNFESLSGYNFGLTWEFPILAKKLGGNTPIIKARAGKSEVKAKTDLASNVKVSSASSNFVESLGVSEIYTVGVGAGYCYHVGFDCAYVMYNTYLTGQLTTVEDNGAISTVPTQLKGISVGMTSSFETVMGMELTLGMEYSMLTHSTPIGDDQEINTFSLVLGLGFLEQSRYLNMQKINFVE